MKNNCRDKLPLTATFCPEVEMPARCGNECNDSTSLTSPSFRYKSLLDSLFLFNREHTKKNKIKNNHKHQEGKENSQTKLNFRVGFVIGRQKTRQMIR